MSESDGDVKVKPESVDKVLDIMKAGPSSEGNVVQVMQGIKDFESSFVRAMKGIAPSCMLHAKLSLHGVCEDLTKLQSKKTALELSNMCFDQTKLRRGILPIIGE